MNRRRSNPGFTLVETMLASLLGMMVVIATVGLFGAMRDADRRSQARAFTTGDLTTLHRTTTRALRSLVMSGRPSGGSATGRTGLTAPGPEENTADRRPRIILEPDGQTGMQRMELVVAEPPIYSTETGAGNAYGAVRGSFELTPEAGRETFAMNWVTYGPGTSAAQTGPVRSRVLVAEGVNRALWRFLKTGEGGRLEPKTTLSVAEFSELPAYAELDLSMQDGRSVKWMFELQWTVAGEPGVVLAAADRIPGPGNRTTNNSGAGGSGRNPGGDKPEDEGPGGIQRPDPTGNADRIGDADHAAREQYILSIERYQSDLRAGIHRKPARPQ